MLIVIDAIITGPLARHSGHFPALDVNATTGML